MTTMVSYSAFLVKYLNGNKMMREKAEMQKRLAWEEAMRERCRIRAGVAGMRIKVEELRSRISRPLEYLMRREQPRQQSLNDVLRDAQRAADAWNRDHAAPQRTYRGRAR